MYGHHNLYDRGYYDSSWWSLWNPFGYYDYYDYDYDSPLRTFGILALFWSALFGLNYYTSQRRCLLFGECNGRTYDRNWIYSGRRYYPDSDSDFGGRRRPSMVSYLVDHIDGPDKDSD